ncbi:hypothetical protein [Arthrobacter sp. JSM 101049]|uniref:hypothetical protein n=1 Tax=Arthrobacter sp. JSM 101049 TaxID=929097 RepID=UPI0035615BEC
MLKTAALVAAAVVLGLGTVQGSLAIWNTEAESGAGTVKAADFKVRLTTGPTTNQRLNGGSTIVTLPAITGLAPGKTQTLSVPVTNDTNAGSGNFRVLVATTQPQLNNLPAGLTATAGMLASGQCETSTWQRSVELAQQGTATLCVTVRMPDGTPATSGGLTGSISVELTATQVQP